MICPRCHREYPDPQKTCEYDGETLVNRARVDLISSKQSQQTGALLGGRYAVKGFVGRGGMARVYLAEDTQTKQAVAVKVLDGPQANDKTSRERFLREAKATAMIDHPNIVRIFDYGQRGDGVPYLVMEFLFGETLGECIRREGHMDAEIALPVLQQVAAGLSAAHQAKVLHRDVKPDNIFLVGEPGEPYAVKVVDFGLAKLRETNLTAAGTVVGTIEYMAPEQCVTDPQDARTDIYGLGVVAFKMFSGRIPFTGETNEEILSRQLIESPPPLRQLVPDLEPGVETFVARATRKHPGNRYQSMNEVLVDLERLLDETPGNLLGDGPDRYPDVFMPRSPFAQTVAKVFYRTLGKQPPDFG